MFNVVKVESVPLNSENFPRPFGPGVPFHPQHVDQGVWERTLELWIYFEVVSYQLPVRPKRPIASVGPPIARRSYR